MDVGRWVGEFQTVWRVSFVDVGLVILACVLGFMVPGLLVQRLGSPVAIAAFWAVALPVIAWLSGAVHLQCFRNAETGKSTSFGEASQEAFERWDDVVLGVVFCGLMLGVAGVLVLPGVVAGGVLLPYVIIVMVEKKGPVEALRRNIELAQGRWVELVVYWMLYYAVLMVGVSVVGGAAVVTAMLGLVSAPPVGGLMAVVLVLSAVGAFFLAPLPVIASVATYRMIVEEAPASVAAPGEEVGVAQEGGEAPELEAPGEVVVSPGGEVAEAPEAQAAEREGVEDDAVFEVERSDLAGDSVFDDDDEASSPKPVPGFQKAPRADEGPYW